MKKSDSVFICLTLALAVLTHLWLLPEQCTASLIKADKVVVIKGKRSLLLLKNGEVLKSYQVALGGNPVGPKTRQGDKRTPEGTYYLDRRNPHSKFYRSMHISYPNAKDIENARERGVSPGRDIMIHGLPKGYGFLGELHTINDWTKGCIAVTDSEMDEIWTLVSDGTPIEIRP
jgi:murein L,D-transpeptidase YafK